jgi:ribosomal protein S13
MNINTNKNMNVKKHKRVLFLNKLINSHLKVRKALLQILGLNRASINFIILSLGLTGEEMLSNDKVFTLVENFIRGKFVTNRIKKQQIRKIKENANLRSNIRDIRSRCKLPVNGQRTHSNARSQKPKSTQKPKSEQSLLSKSVTGRKTGQKSQQGLHKTNQRKR